MANNKTLKDALGNNFVSKTTEDGGGVNTPHVNVDNLPANPPTSVKQDEQTAELLAIKNKIIASPTIAASTNLIGDVGIQVRANATGAASKFHLVSAATTNATNVKNAAGRLLGWRITNTNAAFRYVKLHNSTTAPTAGAGVVETIAVPPNQTITAYIAQGSAFTTGIGITTVTGAADADNTAVGLNDLIIDLYFS